MANKTEKITSERKFSDILKDNTVIKYGLGIIPVVAVSSTLQNAMAISIIYTIVILLTYMFASLIRSDKPGTILIPTYAIFASLAFIPAYLIAEFLFPTVRDMLGNYLYIVIVDTVVIFEAYNRARGKKLGSALKEGLITSLSIAFIAIITSILREFITRGTFYGITISKNISMRGVALPFFGFIFLGLICGLVNFINFLIANPREKEPKKAELKHKTKEQEIKDLIETSTEQKRGGTKREQKTNKKELKEQQRKEKERERQEREAQRERQKRSKAAASKRAAEAKTTDDASKKIESEEKEQEVLNIPVKRQQKQKEIVSENDLKEKSPETINIPKEEVVSEALPVIKEEVSEIKKEELKTEVKQQKNPPDEIEKETLQKEESVEEKEENKVVLPLPPLDEPIREGKLSDESATIETDLSELEETAAKIMEPHKIFDLDMSDILRDKEDTEKSSSEVSLDLGKVQIPDLTDDKTLEEEYKKVINKEAKTEEEKNSEIKKEIENKDGTDKKGFTFDAGNILGDN